MSRAVMQQALEALVTCRAEEWRTLNNFGMKQVYDEKKVNTAIAALHTALAEPQCMCREPWALERVHREKTPCFDYVEHKPLTELEMPTLFVGGLALNNAATTEIVRAVEKAHGIGEQHE